MPHILDTTIVVTWTLQPNALTPDSPPTVETTNNISNFEYNTKVLDVSGPIVTTPNGMWVHPDGTRVWLGASDQFIYEWDLSTPFDISTGVYNANSHLFGNDYAQGVVWHGWSRDGLKGHLIEVGPANDIFLVMQPCTVPYDITTFDGTDLAANKFNLGGTPEHSTTVANYVTYSLDELRVWVTRDFITEKKIIQYDLAVAANPGSITTLTGEEVIFDLAGEFSTDHQIGGLWVSDDGYIMWVLDRGVIATAVTKIVYEYRMTTPNDIATLSYTGNSFDVSAEFLQNNDLGDIVMLGDKTKQYLLDTDSSNRQIFQYDNNWDGLIHDVLVTKPDGTTMYFESGLTTFKGATATVQGKATFNQLVDQLGRWVFQLNNGISTAFTSYSTHEVYVVDPEDPAIDTTYVTFLDPTIHDLGT